MPTNDFKPFSTGGGANVISQDDYLILAALATGFQAGIANPAELNKVWRQATFVAAGLAQVVSDLTNQDVVDNGDLDGFVAQIKSALAGKSKPVRTVTHSTTTPTISLSDGYILSDTTAGNVIITAPTGLVPAGYVFSVPVTMIGTGTSPTIITRDGTTATEVGRIININDGSGAGSLTVHLFNSSVRVTGNP